MKKPLPEIEEGDWAINVQYGRDMHRGRFVEAICCHGIGHHKGIHGCDGCCARAPADLWSQVSEDED